MLNIFSVLYLSLYKNQKVRFLNEAYSVYSFKSIFSFSKYYRRFIYIGNSCFCQKTKIPLLGLSPRFKKFWKIRLGSKLSLGLIYGLSFQIQAASYFPQSWVQKTELIFYLADLHSRNWRIPGFYENKTQHWALFSTKTNQGRFYFHWAYEPSSPSVCTTKAWGHAPLYRYQIDVS